MQAILSSPDVVAALIFCAAALAGQFIHTVKKWAEGQNWILPNFRRTVGAFIGNIVGMAAFIQTGVLAPMMSLPNGTFAIVLFGFMNGFTSDSALNKGTNKVSMEDQQAATP